MGAGAGVWEKVSAPLVEVVIDHWRRPANVPRLLAAFRAQSVPCRLTLVHCAPDAEVPAEWRRLADRVLVLPDQGSSTRFAPAGIFDCEFTYWQDNDMLPGQRCLEHFLEWAGRVEKFAVLGQMGRRWPVSGTYWADEVRRGAVAMPVDFVVRAYFVRTRDLHWMEAFRWRMGAGLPLFEDDLLLCMALRFYTEKPCLLTPWDEDAETLANREELPAPHALSADWGRHLDRRTEFVRRGIAAGWRPLWATTRTDAACGDFGVVMTVVEPPAQVEWAVRRLRAVSPEAPLVLISDGVHDERYDGIATHYGGRYERGEKLKTPERGAEWWQRTFSAGRALGTRYVLKVDADASFNRPIRWWPDYDCFGTVAWGGSDREHVQGGAQGFSRAAVERILDSRICLRAEFRQVDYWSWDAGATGHWEREKYLSTDQTLRRILMELGMRWGEWPEVKSWYLHTPPDAADFAISHAHKAMGAPA